MKTNLNWLGGVWFFLIIRTRRLPGQFIAEMPVVLPGLFQCGNQYEIVTLSWRRFKLLSHNLTTFWLKCRKLAGSYCGGWVVGVEGYYKEKLRFFHIKVSSAVTIVLSNCFFFLENWWDLGFWIVRIEETDASFQRGGLPSQYHESQTSKLSKDRRSLKVPLSVMVKFVLTRISWLKWYLGSVNLCNKISITWIATILTLKLLSRLTLMGWGF